MKPIFKLKQLVFFIALLLYGHAVNAQQTFFDSLSHAAFELTKDPVIYDPAYFAIDYPMGDVPSDRGVCTDVIIRAYRKLGVDLQKEVHEDMRQHFSAYPNHWGLTKTDRNIDHRRVPNLMAFFSRNGTALDISLNNEDYTPGDVVCWSLGEGLTHIGLVSSVKNKDGNRYAMIHNIGGGQVLEDCLFQYKIIGHFRYKK